MPDEKPNRWKVELEFDLPKDDNDAAVALGKKAVQTIAGGGKIISAGISKQTGVDPQGTKFYGEGESLR